VADFARMEPTSRPDDGSYDIKVRSGTEMERRSNSMFFVSVPESLADARRRPSRQEPTTLSLGRRLHAKSCTPALECRLSTSAQLPTAGEVACGAEHKSSPPPLGAATILHSHRERGNGSSGLSSVWLIGQCRVGIAGAVLVREPLRAGRATAECERWSGECWQLLPERPCSVPERGRGQASLTCRRPLHSSAAPTPLAGSR
jgi:hypothetical protein